jgi:hypothetical protein
MLIIRPTDKIEESVIAHPAADFSTFGIAVLLTVPSPGRHRSGCGFGFARWRNLAQRGAQFVLRRAQDPYCVWMPIQKAAEVPKYLPSRRAVSAVTGVCSLASRSIRVRGTPTSRATA